jgi:hypothetical protein
MRSCADQIEVPDLVVAVVAAEPGALRQDRLEAERAAVIGVEIECEIARRIVELGDDAVVDVGDEPAADLVEYALLDQRSDLVPVDR